MVEPRLNKLIQWGFAATSLALIKAKLGGLYLDRESDCAPRAPILKEKIPCFFYSTHSSYWDPVVAAFIAVIYFRRPLIAPMDEAEYLQHTSLRRTGIFGVKEGDGVAVHDLLQRLWKKNPALSLWVTPQGRFVANTERQPPFKEGLSRWSLGRTSVRLPIAIDYRDGAHRGVFVRIGRASRMQAAEQVEAEAIERDSQQLRETLQDTVDRLVGQTDLKKFKRLL